MTMELSMTIALLSALAIGQFFTAIVMINLLLPESRYRSKNRE
jgi:hypothetical protein